MNKQIEKKVLIKEYNFDHRLAKFVTCVLAVISYFFNFWFLTIPLIVFGVDLFTYIIAKLEGHQTQKPGL